MVPERDALIESVRRTYEVGLAIVEKKNKDYGANEDPFRNFRAATMLGLSVEKAILVRTLDKLARINNLLDHEAYVTEETMDDTIVDACNYLAILKAWRECARARVVAPESR